MPTSSFRPSQVAPKKDQTEPTLPFSLYDSKIGPPTDSTNSGDAMNTGFGDPNPLISRSRPDTSVQNSRLELECFYCTEFIGTKDVMIPHVFKEHLDEVCKNSKARKSPDERSRQNPQGNRVLDRHDLLDKATSMSTYVFDQKDTETQSLRGMESDARFLEDMLSDILAEVEVEVIPLVKNLIDRYRACRWDDCEQRDKLNEEFHYFTAKCYTDDTPYHQDAAVLEATLRAEYGPNIRAVLPVSAEDGSVYIAVCLESDCEIPPKTKSGFDVKKGLLHRPCDRVHSSGTQSVPRCKTPSQSEMVGVISGGKIHNGTVTKQIADDIEKAPKGKSSSTTRKSSDRSDEKLKNKRKRKKSKEKSKKKKGHGKKRKIGKGERKRHKKNRKKDNGRKQDQKKEKEEKRKGKYDKRKNCDPEGDSDGMTSERSTKKSKKHR